MGPAHKVASHRKPTHQIPHHSRTLALDDGARKVSSWLRPRSALILHLYFKRSSHLILAWNTTTTTTGGSGTLDDPSRTVDIIICPAGPGPAPPHGCSKYYGYTSQWNLLDYPALVFPVTKVDLTLDVKEEGYVAMNDQDRYIHDLYEPEKFRDAPVGLQIVGRRYEDEKVSAGFPSPPEGRKSMMFVSMKKNANGVAWWPCAYRL